MCSSQGKTREPGTSALGVDSGSHLGWGPCAWPFPYPRGGEGTTCPRGRPWATALTLGNQPHPHGRVSVSPGSTHIMQIVFLAHTAPTSRTAFPHSEVNMHEAPTRVHPIPFKMPRCNSERTFASQKANGEQQVTN